MAHIYSITPFIKVGVQVETYNTTLFVNMTSNLKQEKELRDFVKHH
jgi:hypothetical protein